MIYNTRTHKALPSAFFVFSLRQTLHNMNPIVGIIMGSDSDLSIMQGAADILKEFGIGFELTVVSAHRTPMRMMDYAKTAKDRGLRVIIAGAGGAAHLPGMVASINAIACYWSAYKVV